MNDKNLKAYKGLIMFAVAYAMVVEKGLTTLTSTLDYIKNNVSGSTAPTSNAFTRLKGAGIQSLTYADAGGDDVEAEFTAGDDLDKLNAHLAEFATDETEFLQALEAYLIERDGAPGGEGITGDDETDDYGFDEQGNLLPNYVKLPRVTQGDVVAFLMSTKAEFDEQKNEDNPNSTWEDAKMMISAFTRLNGQPVTRQRKNAQGVMENYTFYPVQYTGTLFTKKHKAGIRQTLRTNTAYTVKAQDSWKDEVTAEDGSGGVDIYGIPKNVNSKNELAMNIRVSKAVKDESVISSTNSAWCQAVKLAGGQVKLVNGKPTCYLKARATATQYSHEGFLEVLPLRQRKLLEEVIKTRAIGSANNDNKDEDRKNKIAQLKDLKVQLEALGYSGDKLEAKMDLAIANL